MIDLSIIPTSPGCYLYRNTTGEIIYVGKAINLKKRVSQYFQRDDALGPKTQALVSQIGSIETKIVGSEIEALILEASLIKKYHPKFNSLLKDDRSYIYICITHDPLPLVFSCHQSNLPVGVDVYGPFPDGSAVQQLLKTIRRVFPFYSRKHSLKTCLYCHLGVCPGPNPDPKAYRQNIGKIKKMLSGSFKLLQKQLVREMKQASLLENYELALTLRQQVESLNYIVSGWHNLRHLYQQVNLPSDIQSQAVNELIATLKPLVPLQTINRLECYDISQMGTKFFVGAMTVWQDGQLNPAEYRKFKIKTKATADDQFMIKEIIWRRLRHPEWTFPDLIIVDGGKPQVSAVAPLFTNLPQSIAFVGLAKKFETIVIKNSTGFTEINLPPNSSALNLLKSLRNEAHRFANSYRQALMKKSINEN